MRKNRKAIQYGSATLSYRHVNKLRKGKSLSCVEVTFDQKNYTISLDSINHFPGAANMCITDLGEKLHRVLQKCREFSHLEQSQDNQVKLSSQAQDALAKRFKSINRLYKAVKNFNGQENLRYDVHERVIHLNFASIGFFKKHITAVPLYTSSQWSNSKALGKAFDQASINLNDLRI